MTCGHKTSEVLTCNSNGTNCITIFECSVCGHRWQRIRLDTVEMPTNPGGKPLLTAKCFRCPYKHNPFL
jgi:hypothetical protein